MLRAFLAAVVLSTLAARVSAQSPSIYVPLDDRVMPFVEHLIRLGTIADPDPLTRPLKRSAIIAELARADTGTAPAAVRAMVRQLATELAPRQPAPVIGLRFSLGPSAGTHPRRDPLREAGPRYASFLTGMEIWAVMGPLVMSSHPFFDRRLRLDPDYHGLKDRTLSFRFTDAYAGVQLRYGELTYGSLARNWGPAGIDGLLVSAAPYSYDHFYLRLGVTGFRVETELAQLNDSLNAAGRFEHRWYVAHRFVFRTWPWMRGVLGQATLWKGGGPLEQSWFLNPTRLAFVAREDDNLADSANTLVSGDLWLQLPHGVVLQAQGLIDDMNLFRTKEAPDRLAGTLLLDVPLGRTASVRGLWTVVSSLTYRAFDGPIMSITRHQVGLGRNYADYSQWTLSGSVAPHSRVVLQPDLTLLVQGEGDIRKPMPPFPATTYPFLFVGTRERTVRLGLAGAATGWRGVDVSANAGLHFVTNRGNVAGASATRFVGTINVRYRFGGEFKAPSVR